MEVCGYYLIKKQEEIKMVNFSYDISLDEDNHLIFLVVRGELNKSEGEKIIIETRTLAAETDSNILCDISRATIRASLAEWFYLARNKEVFPSYPQEKTAILINPDAMKLYKFIEDVTQNVGLKIRIFLKKEDAMAWLKKVG